MLPACVANAGVRIRVEATVPVCSCICGPWLAKIASVVLAGIAKLTVRPPVENWTAGSTVNSLAAVKVRVPVSAAGYVFDNFSPILGCDCAGTSPLAPLNVNPGSAGGEVPDPISPMVVLPTRSVPVVKPTVVGAKLIVKLAFAFGPMLSGNEGNPVTEKALFGSTIPMLKILAATVPALLIVNWADSDPVTAAGVKTTESPVPSDTVVPAMVYANSRFGPNPRPVNVKASLPIARLACSVTACVGVKVILSVKLPLGPRVSGNTGVPLRTKSWLPLSVMEPIVVLRLPVFCTVKVAEVDCLRLVSGSAIWPPGVTRFVCPPSVS